MNAQATGSGGREDDAASTTIGVGGVTSGQRGATPSHETQAETGGSGGEQLTGNQEQGQDQEQARGPASAAPAGKAAKPGEDPAPPRSAGAVPDASESSMQSGARGAFDTRSAQGGGTGTGLGSPESGANQSERDLPPPSSSQGDAR